MLVLSGDIGGTNARLALIELPGGLPREQARAVDLDQLFDDIHLDFASLARARGWPVAASNVPRPLASLVGRGGLAALDTLEAARRAAG